MNIPSIIQQNVPLNDKNWFRTGGNTRYYAAPTSIDDVLAALNFAQDHADSLFILGEGANILISDDGFDGLVLHPQIRDISVVEENDDTVLVCAQAGVSLNDLIEWCLARNIIGLEEFSGIPGTVGGSMYINLHYYQFLLEQFVESAQVINLNSLDPIHVNRDWFEFDYNDSILQRKQDLLIDTTFRLKKVSDIETAYARGRRAEIIRHRTARYPNKNTCGSFFRNFYEDEVTIESNGQAMVYVAYYLDKIGVKGALSVGDAIVSYQHANMIVNQGNATSADIIALARTMQEKVHDAFGIIPQPECQLIGFKTYPLYR